jgi:translation initiation factor 2 beta subunit (eIF-2beta)/eIF-5
MAEKHKSKYKTPKDFEKSQKIHARKDLKDYTHDDKQGTANPFSTGKKQEKVARKTDKAVQDDGKMYQKYTDNDRLYDPESADYDPKHAAKVLSKRQKTDSDEYLKKLELINHGVTTPEIQERLNRLTTAQKELLIREYIRRKILKVIREQGGDTEELPAAEEPKADEPKAEEPKADEPTDTQTTPDASSTTTTPPPTTPPAPTTPAPAPTTPAPTPPTPTTDASAATDANDPKKDVEQQEAENIMAIKKWLEFLKLKQQRGPSSLVSTALSPLAKLIAKLDPEDLERAKNIAIRQIKSIQAPEADQSDSNSESNSEENQTA